MSEILIVSLLTATCAFATTDDEKSSRFSAAMSKVSTRTSAEKSGSYTKPSTNPYESPVNDFQKVASDLIANQGYSAAKAEDAAWSKGFNPWDGLPEYTEETKCAYNVANENPGAALSAIKEKCGIK